MGRVSSYLGLSAALPVPKRNKGPIRDPCLASPRAKHSDPCVYVLYSWFFFLNSLHHPGHKPQNPKPSPCPRRVAFLVFWPQPPVIAASSMGRSPYFTVCRVWISEVKAIVPFYRFLVANSDWLMVYRNANHIWGLNFAILTYDWCIGIQPCPLRWA